ncbi:MAG TPA: DUF3105 domain-containing protein [Chloroflexota bacterium]|nr:DUF3105 domain-containing protein [Chloroflexota bacterium]
MAMLRRTIWTVGLVVALAGLPAMAPGAAFAAASRQADEAAIPGVEVFPDVSAAHRSGPIDYAETPPPGGAHAPVWVNCGAYAQPVPTEMAVHALEHGAVWVTYQPALADADVAALRALARGRAYVLVTPWGDDGLPRPVVAVAWGLRLAVDDATDPRLAEFVARYANGPQTPERGAPCRGGLGTPLPNP